MSDLLPMISVLMLAVVVDLVALVRWFDGNEEVKANKLNQTHMTSTVAVPLGAGLQGESRAPLRSDQMDLRQYMGTYYISVDDIVANGPRQETIVDIQLGNYGRPDLYFKDGSRLSLNVTNTRILGRAYGDNSKDSIDKVIELYIGEIETREGKQNSVLIRPISPTKTPELRSEPKSQAVDKDLNDDVPL